jgi:hypothetical protein
VSLYPYPLPISSRIDDCPSVLAYLLVPKVTELPKPPHVVEREHSSRLSALSNFSIGDMFRDVRDTKSVKFPEKLLKVLEQKLQDIAMGKDSACVFSWSFNLISNPFVVILINSSDALWASSMGNLWWTVSNGR